VSARLAFHEAGHALAAQFLGRRVESVSIGPGGGQMRQEPLPAEATDDEIKLGLVVVFAGPEAERYAPSQERNEDDPWLTPQELVMLDAEPIVSGGPSDEAVIDHYAERLGPEEVEDARAFAAEIVERM
jgi:membrane-associated protease RseP (regulator of RpoE activity)